MNIQGKRMQKGKAVLFYRNIFYLSQQRLDHGQR
jgi:hypothetical protein